MRLSLKRWNIRKPLAPGQRERGILLGEDQRVEVLTPIQVKERTCQDLSQEMTSVSDGSVEKKVTSRNNVANGLTRTRISDKVLTGKSLHWPRMTQRTLLDCWFRRQILLNQIKTSGFLILAARFI